MSAVQESPQFHAAQARMMIVTKPHNL